MPKFFVPEAAPGASFLTLTGQNAAHAKVLRLKPGERVSVCDTRGTDFRCVVSDVAPGQISLVVQHEAPSDAEPDVFCSVYMAFAKAEKLEHVIQKATELGAAEIVAFASSRCVAKPDEKSLAKKLERWQKIAAAAAEQSGRGRIPQVRVIGSFREAVRQAAQCELALLPYENEQTQSLRACLNAGDYRSVSIMTGPEGGFSEEEVAFAGQNNMKICSLGPRILRCETAPLCALTAVLYAAGALDRYTDEKDGNHGKESEIQCQ